MVVGRIVDESAELSANLSEGGDRRRVGLNAAMDKDALEQFSGKREQLRHRHTPPK